MSKRGQFLLLLGLFMADGIAVLLGLLLADWSAHQLHFLTPISGWWLLAGMLAFLLVFSWLNLYDLEIVLEDSEEYAKIVNGCTYGTLLLALLSVAIPQQSLQVPWLVLAWLSCVLLTLLARFAMRRVVRVTRGTGHLLRRAIIVGADQQGRTIARQLRSVTHSGIQVVGFVDDFLPVGTQVQDSLHVIGHPSNLLYLTQQHQAEEVIVVSQAVAWETFQELLTASTLHRKFRLRLSPGYYELLSTTPRVAHRNFVPLILIDEERLTGFDRLLKGTVDYGVGLVAFLLTLPVQILLAIGLFLFQKGKVFSRQHLLGLKGQDFQVWIFHTPNTAFGKFMDHTGLRNLPLLLWVLLGKMSLVGPRPIRVKNKEKVIRWLAALSSLRPGVTGPWAVVGLANLEEEMRATLYYIRNWTIWLDLQILIQTLLVAIRRKWGLLSDDL
ncbi:MAG TPA: sugar transferase [Anaerolineales bacterium]|nr:sugar transferase [Anaerolineales bacterium]